MSFHMFLPVFTCCEPKSVLFLGTALGSQQVKTGKNG